MGAITPANKEVELRNSHLNRLIFGLVPVRNTSLQRLDHGVVVWTEEDGDRVPLFPRDVQHTMNRRHKDIVGPSRQHIRDIDHECTLDWRCKDPFPSRVQDLQPWVHVLTEDSEAFKVRVGANTDRVRVCGVLRWVVQDVAENTWPGYHRIKVILW